MEILALAIIENQYKEILLLRKDKEWMLPGGIVLDEEPEWTLFRKVYEKTGLEVIDFVITLDHDIYLDKRKKTYQCKIYTGSFIGIENTAISPWEQYKGLKEVRWINKKFALTLKLSELTIIGIGNN